MLAFLVYAEAHKGEFPATIDQAASYFSGGEDQEESRLKPDQFEVVYQGPRNKITNVSRIIVLREKQARRYADGRWAKAYAFADGHSEVHGEPTDNFDSFEKQRMIFQPAP